MLCFLDMTDDCGRAKMSKQSVSRAGGPDGNVSRGSSRGRSPPMGRCWHLGWKQERELRKWKTSEDHHKTLWGAEVQEKFSFFLSCRIFSGCFAATWWPKGSTSASCLPFSGVKDGCWIFIAFQMSSWLLCLWSAEQSIRSPIRPPAPWCSLRSLHPLVFPAQKPFCHHPFIPVTSC